MKLTDAIVYVLKKHGGAATIAALFAEVPHLTTAIKSENPEKIAHSIRGSLSYLIGDSRGSRKRIKRIGLGTYALIGHEAENNLYDEIEKKEVVQENFLALPKSKLHGYLQGMLIEIGNMRKFETYTPDKGTVFNGKNLSELSSVRVMPPFTYSARVDIVRQIDVIWLKDDYPVATFDVENSTNFTHAFLRSYQLKYFTTKCFMVADKSKRAMFDRRAATKPFDEIGDRVEFMENASVFETYERMMHLHKLKAGNPLFID